MIYVDKEIKELLASKRIIIESFDNKHPFDIEKQIGAGSIDLRLGTLFRKFKEDVELIDLNVSGDTLLEEKKIDEEVVIYPNELVIATTMEWVLLPPDIAGFLTGRSSIARLGLMVQCCQDFIHPGHQQLIPLQLINVTNKPIKINTNLRICQLILIKASNSAEVPYSSNPESKYKDEVIAPKSSRIGIEVGQDKKSDFSDEKPPDDAVKEIEKLRRSLLDQSKEVELVSLRKNLSNVSYIILGAAISVLLPEIKAQPFPSVIFLIACLFIILCLVYLYLIHRK